MHELASVPHRTVGIVESKAGVVVVAVFAVVTDTVGAVCTLCAPTSVAAGLDTSKLLFDCSSVVPASDKSSASAINTIMRNVSLRDAIA